jgi:(p)ppGpp synthase/HD superfamily hydrolase
MTIWKQLDSAIAFAATAHAGQVRKYSALPYIVHPIEVMEIVLTRSVLPVTEDQLVAAVLHDVVEDTPVGLRDITRRYGPEVARLVYELTDQFTDPKLGNRAARKAMERERLATISAEAQTIKYADFISNTKSIVEHDRNFARVYLAEKEAILKVMREGDEALLSAAELSLQWGQTQLVQEALR